MRAISGSSSSSATTAAAAAAAAEGGLVVSVFFVEVGAAREGVGGLVLVDPLTLDDIDEGGLVVDGGGEEGALAEEVDAEVGFVVEEVGFEGGFLGGRRGERVRVCLIGSLRAGERERDL